MDCVRIKIKNAQLRTQSIPLASSKPVSFAGLLPNGSAHTFSSRIPILKTIARKFIMNYVRRGKDKYNFYFRHKFAILYLFLSLNIR